MNLNNKQFDHKLQIRLHTNDHHIVSDINGKMNMSAAAGKYIVQDSTEEC